MHIRQPFVMTFSIVIMVGSTLLGPVLAAGKRPANAPGIVVTEVTRGKAGDRSGLRKGDILVSWNWRTAGAKKDVGAGTFGVPMELSALENSLAAEGRVTVKGTREGRPLELTVSDGEWAVSSRPNFSGAELEAYQRAQGPAPGSPADPTALLALSDRVLKRGGAAESAWLRIKAAESLARSKKLDEVRPALDRALADAKAKVPAQVYAEFLIEAATMRLALGDSEAASGLAREAVDLWKKVSPGTGYGGALFHPAEVSFRKGDLDGAMEGFRQSLAVLESVAPASYLAARSTSRIGEVFWAKGRLDEAQEYFQRAYALVEKMAPGGAELVGPANNLGKVRFQKGDALGAEKIFRRSVGIVEVNEPGSLELARSLNGLGLIVTDLGDYPEAERLLKRAVDIWRVQAPGSPNGWRPYFNLGNVYLHRGDLAKADECYSAVLDMVRKIAPGSLQEASCLGNLAAVSGKRRDYDTEESLLQKVFEITEKQAPGSPDLARCHEYLGSADINRGRLDEGLDHYRKAVAILRENSPGSVQLARCLRTQGAICLRARRTQEAKGFLEDALATFESVNPASQETASATTLLGILALEEKDTDSALEKLGRAVDIFGRSGYPTELYAEGLHYRGLALRAAGRNAEAGDSLRRAIETVENLAERLGGSSQDRATFIEGYADYYLQLEDLLLEQGESKEAFRTVERWRATEFLRMLAERDLDLGGETSPALERERRLASADLEKLWAALDAGVASESKEMADLEVRIRAAQKRLEDVRLETLKASKGVYNLRYPEALGVEQASAVLEEGTMLLEYSVSPDRAILFALGPGRDEFTATVLPVRGEDLRKDVERFRATVLAAGGAAGGPAADVELRSLSSKLSGTLLGPVSGRIARARRLLVAPDSALYYLPFSALADPATPSGSGRPRGKAPFRYLVESKPVHTVASATVYAQLLGRRRGAGELSLEAFGDPVYGKTLLPGRWRGRELGPLPATRGEVEGIREVLGAGKVHLGADATPSNALALPRDTRIVHFACHGFTDEDRPLESALALSPAEGRGGERDDGLLQAWEIYERLRVDADLVTLSACETGLGKVIEGEGLVGLTRAFQFAGARTVLASLWPVSDESTAQLMRAFYANLRAGQSKDEALRAAQVLLLRQKTPEKRGAKGSEEKAGPFAGPFHWAAFELVGDWK